METRHGFATIYRSAENQWTGSADVTFDRPMPDTNYAVTIEPYPEHSYHFWAWAIQQKAPDGFEVVIWPTTDSIVPALPNGWMANWTAIRRYD